MLVPIQILFFWHTWYSVLYNVLVTKAKPYLHLAIIILQISNHVLGILLSSIHTKKNCHVLLLSFLVLINVYFQGKHFLGYPLLKIQSFSEKCKCVKE